MPDILNASMQLDVAPYIAAIDQKIRADEKDIGVTQTIIQGKARLIEELDIVTGKVIDSKIAVEQYNLTLADAATVTNRLDANEKLISVSYKNTTAAIQAKKAALDALILAQTRAKGSSEFGIQMIRAQTPTNTFASKATLQENFAFNKGLSDLSALAAASNVTGARLYSMWQQASKGALVYDASIKGVQAQLIKTIGLESARGVVAQKASLMAAAEAERNAIAMNKVAAAIANANNSSKSFLLSWQSFARLLTIQLLHQVISQLSQAIKQGTADAMEFQIRISEIRTISQDAGLSFAEWATGIRQVSDSFGLPILTVAEGAYQAISNQVVKGADAFKFMSDAARLAITTVATIDNSVNALSSVINAYGMKASDATEISAKLFTAVNLGRFRLDEAANSLGNIAVIARETGVSFDELLAGMVSMTIQGFTWSQSMTQMRGFITQLIKPSVDMGKFLKQIGVESGEAAIRTFGLIGIIDKLTEVTKGSSTALAEEIRNIRGLLFALTASGQGHKAYVESLDKIRNSTVEFTNATEIAMESNAKKIQLETTKVRNYFIKDLGDGVLEGLAKAAIALGGFENVVKNAFATIKTAVELGVLFIISQLGKLQGAANTFMVFAATNPIALGLIAIGSLAVIATNALTRAQEQLAEAEAAEFKQFKANETERKNILAERTRNELTAVTTPLQSAASGVAIKAAEAISKMTKVIDDTIEQSKVIAKIIDEAISGVIQSLRGELSETQKLITSTESQIKGADKFVKDFDKRIQQMRDDFTQVDLVGKPVEQIEFLNKRLKVLAGDLKKTLTLDDVKRVGDQILDNVKDQETIQRDTDKKNITNATERQRIEKDIRNESFKFGERELDLNARIESLTKKRFKGENQLKLDAVKHDRAALESQHKQKLDDLNKELEEHKVVELKKIDFDKRLMAIRKAIMSQTSGVTAFNLGKVSDLLSTKITIEERIKLLENLKQELDRLNFEKILKEDPAHIEKWFEDRANMIQRAIDVMTAQLPTLPDLEKKKIEEIINQLAAERAAIVLKITGIPGIEKGAKDATESLNKTEQAVKFLVEDLGKLRDGIGAIQGLLKTGFQKTIEQTKTGGWFSPSGQFYEQNQLKTEYGEDIGKKLEAVMRGMMANPKLFTELPAKLQDIILKNANMTQAGITLLFKLTYQSENASNQLEILKTDAMLLAEQFSNKVSPAADAVAKSMGDVTKSSVGAATAIVTFSTTLTTLSDKINALVIPGSPESIVPIKQSKFKTDALGGMTMFGTDSVPAMLSPGEFVMNAASTRRFYGQLVAMNSVGRFADGGVAGGNTTVGDINISMKSSGNESVDVIHLGRLLQREIRRGTICLS